MNAGELVNKMGADLVGRRVMTEECGQYPGGPATVIEIDHDPQSPEIVCLVRHDTWRDLRSDSGEMGILENENLDLI